LFSWTFIKLVDTEISKILHSCSQNYFVFSECTPRSGNLELGSSLYWFTCVHQSLSTFWSEKKIENSVIICAKRLSFVQLNVKANWLRADRVASRYQYISPVGQSTTRSAEGESGLRVSQSRTFVQLVRVFATMSINCIRILYTRNTVKFVPALPQWRSAGFARSKVSLKEAESLDLIKLPLQ